MSRKLTVPCQGSPMSSIYCHRMPQKFRKPCHPLRKQTIESEHPYRSNMDERRVLFFPGNPSKLIVSFSETTRTETSCDYILLLDRNGASLHPLIEKFTGRDGDDNWPGQKGRPPMELPGTSSCPCLASCPAPNFVHCNWMCKLKCFPCRK